MKTLNGYGDIYSLKAPIRFFQGMAAGRLFQRICQTAALLLINGHYNFISTLHIYQGGLKSFCAPVINCHSCPLALYACPVGALQYFIMTGRFPVYVLSIIVLTGMTVGRMSCGLLCPFGFLQDILYKIGTVRTELPKWCTFLKYAVLLVIVFGLTFYFSFPVFCKLCPVAILEAGLPLAFVEKDIVGRLFSTETGTFTGWMFLFKSGFLAVILVAAVSIKRPFCRILCPLGAIFGLFNRFSIIRIEVDTDKCSSCGRCARICPVDIDIFNNPDSPECVRCMKCTSCECISATLRPILAPARKEKHNA